MADTCNNETIKNKDKYLKKFQDVQKIKSEECSVIPMVMTLCLSLEAEKVKYLNHPQIEKPLK